MITDIKILWRDIAARVLSTKGSEEIDENIRWFATVLEKVRQSERAACAKIADRCADGETRKALGANAAINASQIANAIRARSAK